MFAESAMDHATCKEEVWLRWRQFDDFVEIVKRPPLLTQLVHT